jgi:hypothetical protein
MGGSESYVVLLPLVAITSQAGTRRSSVCSMQYSHIVYAPHDMQSDCHVVQSSLGVVRSKVNTHLPIILDSLLEYTKTGNQALRTPLVSCKYHHTPLLQCMLHLLQVMKYIAWTSGTSTSTFTLIDCQMIYLNVHCGWWSDVAITFGRASSCRSKQQMCLSTIHQCKYAAGSGTCCQTLMMTCW